MNVAKTLCALEVCLKEHSGTFVVPVPKNGAITQSNLLELPCDGGWGRCANSICAIVWD
jgi:hypothetical protein